MLLAGEPAEAFTPGRGSGKGGAAVRPTGDPYAWRLTGNTDGNYSRTSLQARLTSMNRVYSCYSTWIGLVFRVPGFWKPGSCEHALGRDIGRQGRYKYGTLPAVHADKNVPKRRAPAKPPLSQRSAVLLHPRGPSRARAVPRRGQGEHVVPRHGVAHGQGDGPVDVVDLADGETCSRRASVCQSG